MRRMSGFLVRRSRWILVATGLVTVALACQFSRASFDPDISGILLEGPRGRELTDHRERFGGGDPITVLVRLQGQRFSEKPALLALLDYKQALTAQVGVASITSILPAHNPLDGRPLTAQLIRDVPDWLLSRLLSTSVAHLLLDDSQHNTLLLVMPEDGTDAVALVERLRSVTPPAGFEVRLAGSPVIVDAMIDAIGWPLLVMPLMVLALLVGIFYLALRSLPATLVALSPAVLGTVWTLGLIFGLGYQLDLLTISVPLFVIVMGSADGLHLVTHLQRAPVGDFDAETARVTAVGVDHALQQVGVPMVLTTVSTAIGFASLLMTDIRPVQEFGALVATGIVLAGLISWFSLPALLVHLDVHPRSLRADRAEATTPWAPGQAVERRILALASRRVGAAVLAVSIVGAGALFVPRLHVDPDPLFFFDPDEPIREGFARMTEMFGGGTPLTGEFAFDPDAPADPQFSRMRALSRQLEAMPGVRNVFSLADAARFLPRDMVRAALRGKGPAGLGKLASERSVLFLLLPEEHTSRQLQAWMRFADETPEIVVLCGLSVLFDELSQRMLDGLIRSLVTAFLLIALLLAVAYRSQWEILVALVPLSLTTGALLAFIAAAGIHINLVTMVVSGVVIGVAIDYAIHLIAAIHDERPLGDGYVGRALRHTGWPILANALGIALSMSALVLSPVRPPGQIAAIMWVTMTVGALTALLIIPACYPRHAIVEESD